ncbi:hypothetical protein [Streptomyces sp. NPDC002788]
MRTATCIFRAPASSVAKPVRSSISRRASRAASDVASAAAWHLAVKTWGDAGVQGDFTPDPNFPSAVEMLASTAFFTFSAIWAFVGAVGSFEGGAELPDGLAEGPSSSESLHPAQKAATRPATAAARNTYRFIVIPSDGGVTHREGHARSGKSFKRRNRLIDAHARKA